jgi:mannose-1-phosphate guanylyltransferase
MPIKGYPLMDYWLYFLSKAGISEVIVNTHYQAKCVKEYLGRSRYAKWVSTSHEEILLGTAATLRFNYPRLKGKRILLLHADNWCPIDLNQFINHHDATVHKNYAMTMMTFKCDNPSECGIVALDSSGTVKEFFEKSGNPPGNIANAAVYILEPIVLEWIAANPDASDFSLDVIPQFIGRINTFHNAVIHRDIGSIKSLKLAQKDRISKIAWPIADEWQRNFIKNPIHSLVKS